MRIVIAALFGAMLMSLMGAKCSCARSDKPKTDDDAWINAEPTEAAVEVPVPGQDGSPDPSKQGTPSSQSPSPTSTVMPEDAPGPETLSGDEDM
jgi:hypothetical protein